MLTVRRNVTLFVLLAAVTVLSLSSCGSSKDITYLQDKVLNDPVALEKNAGIVIEPKDMLSIVVNSRTPELAPMFNLPLVNISAGSDTASGTQRISCYAVDEEGCINFPVLGRLKISGMTRWECA